MPRLTFVARSLIAVALSSATLLGQASSPSSAIASDPDVLGAERLFSAWLEGQIAYRGLPGIAVSVVSNQELVWATGFGFADLKAKRAMTPTAR